MIGAYLENYNIHPFETAPMRVRDYLNVDPNAQDENGNTPVHKYVSNRSFNARKMQRLISNGANLELRNRTGKTAFLLAVVLRQKNMIETFIESGVDVEVQDNAGNNALHYVVLPELNFDIEHADGKEGCDFKDILSILKRLLNEGVNVNAKNREGDTPLMWAARGDHLEIVQMLLQFGANVYLQNKIKFTYLHFAPLYYTRNYLCTSLCMLSKFAILSELVRNKACVNCFDKQNRTPLGVILIFGREHRISLAKELIKAATLENWKRRILFHITKSQVLGASKNEKEVQEPELEKYADNVYKEISLMKVHELPGGYNLCEFARGGVSEDELRSIPVIKDEVLRILVKESFPFYGDLLLNRLGRLYLRWKVSNLVLFSRRANRDIYLNSATIYSISDFLDNNKLFNMLAAFPEQLN